MKFRHGKPESRNPIGSESNWITWGDALEEAGFRHNAMTGKSSDQHLLEKLIELIRELGHYPVKAEIRMKARRDQQFPPEAKRSVLELTGQSFVLLLRRG